LLTPSAIARIGFKAGPDDDKLLNELRTLTGKVSGRVIQPDGTVHGLLSVEMGPCRDDRCSGPGSVQFAYPLVPLSPPTPPAPRNYDR
jgi:hypothetical protein